MCDRFLRAFKVKAGAILQIRSSRLPSFFDRLSASLDVFIRLRGTRYAATSPRFFSMASGLGIFPRKAL